MGMPIPLIMRGPPSPPPMPAKEGRVPPPPPTRPAIPASSLSPQDDSANWHVSTKEGPDGKRTPFYVFLPDQRKSTHDKPTCIPLQVRSKDRSKQLRKSSAAPREETNNDS